MSQINEIISFRKKFNCSIYNTTSNVFSQTLILFQLYYYIDFFGAAVGAIGTKFSIKRIWNLINLTSLRRLADQTKNESKKFRTNLLLYNALFIIIGGLTFFTLDYNPNKILI